MSGPAAWTPWRALEPPLVLPAHSLAETLDGGQAFRWNRTGDGGWEGIWGHCLARLRVDGEGRLLWSAPGALAATVERELPRYLACGRDFATLAEKLPWAGDPHLGRALNAWPRLRLLHQPLGETLLAFLCSPTKQIAQIKQCCEELARRLGPEITPGRHALPDWPVLAGVSEQALRACRLGYRARTIAGTAARLAEDPQILAHLEDLPMEQARARLTGLPGVGPKIADCVLLFGAGRLEAFPMDTWILRALRQLYGLDATWRPAHLERFVQVHFAPAPGLAQQYLFALMRQGGGEAAAVPS